MCIPQSVCDMHIMKLLRMTLRPYNVEHLVVYQLVFCQKLQLHQIDMSCRNNNNLFTIMPLHQNKNLPRRLTNIKHQLVTSSFIKKHQIVTKHQVDMDKIHQHHHKK